jgi:uroporphyrinogen III methyltransferase / synthase
VGDLDANALRGKRVLVTRALEQSDDVVQALREAGAVPVVLPMVKFAPPDDFAPLDEALQHARDFDWLLLTSQNAARALQQRCAALHLEIAGIFQGVRIAAVGPASAETARELGLNVIHVASMYQGVALANELAVKLKGMRVFLPRSDRANHDLVEALIGHGAVVTEVIAYKTELPSGNDLAEIRAQLKQGVDAVLFFSPSAVNHFRGVLGQKDFERLAKTCGGFAAIGPVTEAALRQAGVEQIIVAKSATVTSLLSALTHHFSATPQSISAGAKRG